MAATAPYRTKAHPKAVALDVEVVRLSRESTDAHYPARPSYVRNADRGTVKWGCAGCDYWTGYQSRHKANSMIHQHCTTKNSDTGGTE